MQTAERQRLPTLWAARLTVFIFIAGFSIWFVYIPWKIELLGITELQFSLSLFVLAAVSMIVMQLCSRVMIPRFGTGPIMVAALALFPLSLLPFALASTYGSFLALAAVVGVTCGLVTPPAIIETMHLERATGRIFVAVHLAFFSLGGLFGSAASGVLIANDVSAETTFRGVALAGVTISLLVYLFLVRGQTTSTARPPPLRVPGRGILLFGALAAINMATVGVILDWSALWLTRDLAVAAALGGAIIFAFNGGEIASRLLGERLLNRYGETLVGGYAMTAGGLVLLAAILLANPVVIILAFMVFGFLTANFIPVVFRAGVRQAGDDPDAAAADINFIGFTGIFFGPPIIGVLATYLSLTACMMILAIAWALCGLVLVRQLRTQDAAAVHS